jgi:hypothetical protein
MNEVVGNTGLNHFYYNYSHSVRVTPVVSQIVAAKVKRLKIMNPTQIYFARNNFAQYV